MSARVQDAQITAQGIGSQEDSMAPAAGSGTLMVRALLARGQRDPNLIAGVLQGHPGAVAEIVAFLNQTLGNRFVQAVLSAFTPDAASGANDATGATGAMRVTARGLHVRSSPNKKSDSNIVGTLPHHTIVEATGRHGDWVAIEHESRPAFAFGRYLEPVSKPTVAETGGAADVVPIEPDEQTDAPAPAPTPTAIEPE